MKRRSILLVATLSVIFLFGTISACAALTTRYVNPDGTCGGNSPCYTTIQAAVDAADPGDTIHVAAGTYTEDVNIPAGKDYLRLVGHSKDDTIIEATNIGIFAKSPVIIQGLSSRAHSHLLPEAAMSPLTEPDLRFSLIRLFRRTSPPFSG